MSKEREKKVKQISAKTIDAIIDYLLSVEIEYRELAMKAAFATSFKVIRESLGEDEARKFLLEIMLKENMAAEIRPQNETLH